MSLLVFGVFCIFNFSPLFPLSNSNCLLTPAMKTNIVIWDKVFKRGLSEFIKGCLPQNLVIPLLNTLSHIFFMAKRNFKSHKFHFGSHVNTLSIPWFILLIYYFFKKDFHICFGNHLRLSFGNVYWFVHAEAHEQKRDISRR